MVWGIIPILFPAVEESSMRNGLPGYNAAYVILNDLGRIQHVNVVSEARIVTRYGTR